MIIQLVARFPEGGEFEARFGVKPGNDAYARCVMITSFNANSSLTVSKRDAANVTSLIFIHDRDHRIGSMYLQ